MSTITFPELTETVGKLNAKRKELHDVFTEAGPEMDMAKVTTVKGDSAAKVEAIRALNAEIDELAIKTESLKTILKGAENGADYDAAPGTETGAGTDKGPRREKSLVDRIGDALEAAPSRKRMDATDIPFDDVKAFLKTTMTTSAGWATQAVRTDRLVDFATRQPKLLDFIPTVTTDQSAVVYMEETTFTNAAAETTEGAAKPEATLAYTQRTLTVAKIAVTLPVTDEQLDDVPRMRQILENRLPFMVRQRLASQILVGDGTPPNMRGLLNTSGIQTQAKGADPTPDAIYKAMVLVMTTGFADPDLVVFNALDWQDVRLLRTADGMYIWGSPSEAGPNRIWGLPVVLEQGLTQNTAVVGAFEAYSELDIKKQITVETGYVNDNFSKNLQTLRAEMRAVPVFYRPTAFCQVTGV